VLGVQKVRGCIAYVDMKRVVYVSPGRREGGRI